MRRLSVWAALVTSIGSCLGIAVAGWFQRSVVGWLVCLGVLAIPVLMAMAYERPGRQLLPGPLRHVYPVACLIGLASVIRARDLGWPHISSTAMGVVVFVAVLLAYVLAGLREPISDHPVVELALPVAAGRWLVEVGGVSAFNHHLHRHEQRGALDLVRVSRDGARARGVCPVELSAYASYGADVVSPCAGVVTEVVADQPDAGAHTARRKPPPGNLVGIDAGGTTILLAHLRVGSVRVKVGDRVAVGQVVGEVGNSGGSAEPHLHIHAERDGQALRLRFAGAPARRLRPGVRIRAENT